MKTSIQHIIQFLENRAPLAYQESYDNAGLIVGNADTEFKRGLICLDLTEDVLQEAIDTHANLIITHHPFIFHAFKKISGHTLAERLLIKAVKHDICIYAMHTNLDNMLHGVNAQFARLLGLNHCRILQPVDHRLTKLSVFVPAKHADKVRNALFDAGCGHIGMYDSCSYNVSGTGTFRALEGSHPYVGDLNCIHQEEEIKIETIFPDYKQQEVIQALLTVHPYEEPAFDLYPLKNTLPVVGAGMIGLLAAPMPLTDFFTMLKQNMQVKHFRYSTADLGKIITKVAICGGSGAFLIPQAIQAGADIFISSEFKHNQYIDYGKDIILVDIGHYESEIQTKYLIFDQLIEKFSNFAVSLREKNPTEFF